MVIITNNKENNNSVEFKQEVLNYFTKQLLDNDPTLIDTFLSSIENSDGRAKPITFAYDYKEKKLVFKRAVLGQSVFIGELNLNRYKANAFIKSFFKDHRWYNYELLVKRKQTELLEQFREGFKQFLTNNVIPKLIKNYQTAVVEEQLDEKLLTDNLWNLAFYRRIDDYPVEVIKKFIRKEAINNRIKQSCDLTNDLVKSVINKGVTAKELFTELKGFHHTDPLKRLIRNNPTAAETASVELIENAMEYSKQKELSNSRWLASGYHYHEASSVIRSLLELKDEDGLIIDSFDSKELIIKKAVNKLIELLNNCLLNNNYDSFKLVLQNTLRVLIPLVEGTGLRIVRQSYNSISRFIDKQFNKEDDSYFFQRDVFRDKELSSLVESSITKGFFIGLQLEAIEVNRALSNTGLLGYNNKEFFFTKEAKEDAIQNFSIMKQFNQQLGNEEYDDEPMKKRLFERVTVLDESRIVNDTWWDQSITKEFFIIIKDETIGA